MRRSSRSCAVSTANCRHFLVILLVVVSFCNNSVVRASSAPVDHKPNTGSGSFESTAARTLSSSPSIVGVPVATPNHVAVGNARASTGLDVVAESDVKNSDDGLTPSLVDQTDEHKVRTKRDWKKTRVQAAWGKRGNDEAASAGGARVDDSRRRRKWNQVGRQAWGKRNSETTDIFGRLLDTNDDQDDVADTDDAVPIRSTRKWGVGSAKAAWGKRKWGASNDMRVWGKRSINDEEFDNNRLDVNIERQETGSRPAKVGSRSRRSLANGDLTGRPWTISDRLLPEDAIAAKRTRMSSMPAPVAFRRGYIGPKRNWQTNTMKIWGKRSDATFGSSMDSDVNEENDRLAHVPEESANVWDDVDDDFDKVAWKRGWSSDNSLRVWG